jgi:hypothetical protein
MGLYGLYSSVEGPDGNGLFSPYDPEFGGQGGKASTNAGSTSPALCTGGFTPPDQSSTTITALVKLRTPATGAPTASGTITLMGEFIRNGNTVTQQGLGVSRDAQLSGALAFASAKLVVDTTQTPNQVTVQVQPGGPTPPAISWTWQCGMPVSL